MQGDESHSLDFHVFSSDLQPFSNPSDVATLLERQLLSTNWQELCEGLLQFRRILKFHAFLIEEKVNQLVPHVVTCLTNLRSAVVKAALLCIEELVLSLKGDINRFVDGSDSCILLSVINKSSFEKKFIMAQAHSVLGSLIAVLPTVNVVEVALLLTSHIRPTFRAQVAFAMDLALQKVDNIQEELSEFYIQLLHESFKLVRTTQVKLSPCLKSTKANDSHERTRRYGSQVVTKIQDSFLRTSSLEEWHDLLLQNLDTNLLMAVSRRQARTVNSL